MAAIAAGDRGKPVAALHPGGKQSRLMQCGLGTVGALVDDALAGYPALGSIPAMGRQSVLAIQQRLAVLAASVLANGSVDWEGFERRCGLGPTGSAEDRFVLGASDRKRPVEALHLGSRTPRLRDAGLATVGDMLDDRKNLFRNVTRVRGMGQGVVKLLTQRLASLESFVDAAGAADWARFDGLWGGMSDGLVEASALPPLDDAVKARPVEVLRLGTKTAFLHAAGLHTLGDLAAEGVIDRLRSLRGIGLKTARLVSERLAALRNSAEAAGPPPLDDAVKMRPVEVLRLGTKAAFLHAAGLHTLGDLAAEGVIDRLRSLRGIGPRTMRLVPERLAALRNSAAETGGEPDWDRIAKAWGFASTPEEPVGDSDSFLAALPEVIATVVGGYESAMERLILSERISRAHAERMTLEAIGIKFQVSREAVRQAQVRLLENLSDALINDDQSHMAIHFRESFREFWVRAARHFQDIAELDYTEFERGLEEVWSLPAGQLAPFMPLAVAILSDGVKIPASGPDLHPALATTPEEILERPLHEFPVRRARKGLEGAGIVSFGLMLKAARQDQLPPGQDGQIAIKILNGVGRALAEGPAAGVDAWAACLGLTALPRIDPADGAAFIGSLDEALAEAAQVNGTSGRAEQIYRLRTCIPRRRRPTLQDVAAELETHGPSVKREETVLLASLHTQLVEGDMTDAAVIWRPSFLSFFKVAKELHDLACGDYSRFCSSLGLRWGVDSNEVRNSVEGLWAVLALYPGGRRARLMRTRTAAPVRSREEASPTPALSGGVVVLRGFRRPH